MGLMLELAISNQITPNARPLLFGMMTPALRIIPIKNTGKTQT